MRILAGTLNLPIISTYFLLSFDPRLKKPLIHFRLSCDILHTSCKTSFRKADILDQFLILILTLLPDVIALLRLFSNRKVADFVHRFNTECPHTVSGSILDQSDTQLSLKTTGIYKHCGKGNIKRAPQRPSRYTSSSVFEPCICVNGVKYRPVRVTIKALSTIYFTRSHNGNLRSKPIDVLSDRLKMLCSRVSCGDTRASSGTMNLLNIYSS